MENTIGTTLAGSKILRNASLTDEEREYLRKVKDLFGNEWDCEPYRGWSGSENYENDLSLFYKYGYGSNERVLTVRVCLSDDCEDMTVTLDPFVNKYNASIEYMNPYEGYFCGIHTLFTCTKDVREWIRGTKPIFDRLRGRDKDN